MAYQYKKAPASPKKGTNTRTAEPSPQKVRQWARTLVASMRDMDKDLSVNYGRAKSKGI